MTVRLDQGAVERAAAGCALRLPRGPHRGKLGEVRASSVGSSLELHDFRQYQPGRRPAADRLERGGPHRRALPARAAGRGEPPRGGAGRRLGLDGHLGTRRPRGRARWRPGCARWRGVAGLDPVVIATGPHRAQGRGPGDPRDAGVARVRRARVVRRGDEARAAAAAVRVAGGGERLPLRLARPSPSPSGSPAARRAWPWCRCSTRRISIRPAARARA